MGDRQSVCDRQSAGGHFGNAVVPSSNSPGRGDVYRCSTHTSVTSEVCSNHNQAESLERLQAALMPMVQLRQETYSKWILSVIDLGFGWWMILQLTAPTAVG